jgi:hypothetical protein
VVEVELPCLEVLVVLGEPLYLGVQVVLMEALYLGPMVSH